MNELADAIGPLALRIDRRRLLGLAALALAGGPALARGRQVERLRLGAVLPLPTGVDSILDPVGRAAGIGAQLADDLIGREAAAAGIDLRVLLASAPSAPAAVRAAERLVATEGVSALIGGFGGTAEALSEIAEERGVLFFNVGASDDALRNEHCRPWSFHIEASAAMYLDALVGWFAAAGSGSWYVVSEASEWGRARSERARRAIAAAGGETSGGAEVAAGQFIYNDVLAEIESLEPEAVLLLLDAADQEFFSAQYEVERLAIPLTGFPDPVTQTRDYYARLKQVAPTAGSGYRVALWDATLPGAAAELNERFGAREGVPMDPSGWATFAAVKIAFEAAAAAASAEAAAIRAELERPGAHFDVAKGVAVSFRPWDHQLQQPLYLVKIDPEAEWGLPLAQRVAFAELVGELPTLYRPDVERETAIAALGDGPGDTPCPR